MPADEGEPFARFRCMTPASEVLTVDVSDHVATVWLDRPEKLNAMNMAFWNDLPPIMEALGNDPSVRAVVIAGRGNAFSVGLDLMEFGATMLVPQGNSRASGSATLLADIKRMQRATSSVAECSKPVIAAVHGWCIGGAIDLITACDIRIASQDAVFSVRETKLAIVADMGTLQRLPRIVDPGWVAELAFTGRDATASEAKEMGLVTHLYEDVDRLHKEAASLAQQIAANSPIVVSGVKSVLRANDGRTVDEGLDYVALWNAAHLHSADLLEAVAAHMERRNPEFTGE